MSDDKGTPDTGADKDTDTNATEVAALEKLDASALVSIIGDLRRENAAKRVASKGLEERLAELEKERQEAENAKAEAERADLEHREEFRKLYEAEKAKREALEKEASAASEKVTRYENTLEAEYLEISAELGEDVVSQLGIATLPVETRLSVVRSYAKTLGKSVKEPPKTPETPRGGSKPRTEDRTVSEREAILNDATLTNRQKAARLRAL